jgi:glycosyltransferase involved in cell wall biosynthesis
VAERGVVAGAANDTGRHCVEASLVWSKNVNHQQVGDKHRDAREWHKAEEAYRRHLTAHPNDAGIWVQYGHSLKEMGQVEAAEGAYTTATTLAPKDFDAYVHLAHLQMVQGKIAVALETFREASELGAHDEVDAVIETLVRQLQKDVTPVDTDRTNLFSVQDLFFYLKHHATMSGIQRVQAGIAMEVMAMDDFDAGFILTDFTGALPDGSFWLLDEDALKAVIDYASGEKVEHSQLKRLLAICEQTATPVMAGAGNTVVLLGAFWGLGNTIDRYLPAKRAGARLAAYIYDIIPISHPEYCDAGLVRDFTTSLSELCLVCDYMLTISDFTRITLDKFLADNGGRAIPTATVPLAHSLTGPPSSVQSWPQALQRLKGREFVAYVSTVEGRKNHSYVVNVWRKLIADGVDVPDLVFVGRKGWRINGLMDLLDGTKNLDGRVHIVHDLTDAELNAVYENSLFTVFTSFVEGWGLPVGESLLHHTPCVASNTSSIPEVGGDFVDYVDPLNVNEGVAVIGKLIRDREYLAERRRNIVDNFEPRGWMEVAQSFVSQMRAQEGVPVIPASYPKLPEGRQFRPGDIANHTLPLGQYVSNPTRFLIIDHFYTPEDFGAWMAGNFGEITFHTDLEEGTAINIYVSLRAAPWFGNCKATVVLGDARRSETRPIRHRDISPNGLFIVQGLVGKDGFCRVSIEIEGDWQVPEGDSRHFAIGLDGIGYARSSNLAARADLLESFTFNVASVPIAESA